MITAFQGAMHEQRTLFLHLKGSKTCIESNQSVPLSSFGDKRQCSRSLILKHECIRISWETVKTQIVGFPQSLMQQIWGGAGEESSHKSQGDVHVAGVGTTFR